MVKVRRRKGQASVDHGQEQVARHAGSQVEVLGVGRPPSTCLQCQLGVLPLPAYLPALERLTHLATYLPAWERQVASWAATKPNPPMFPPNRERIAT